MNPEFENELTDELEDAEYGEEEASEDDLYDEDYVFDEDGEIVSEDASEDATEDATEDASEDEEIAEQKNGERADVESAFGGAVDEKRGELEGELSRMRSDATELEGLVEKALEVLGFSGEGDAKSKLIKFIADEHGMSEDEYVKAEQEKAENQRAVDFYKRAQYNEMKAKHLLAIHKKYPHTKKYTDVEQLPNFTEFGRMCDSGVSPEQAYAATHVEEIVQSTVTAVRQEEKNNKQHMHSNTTRGGRGGRVRIPPAELALWRDAHPLLSEKEVVELYYETL